MRELKIEDVEQVNGGDAVEALGLWGLAISIVGITGIATLGVASAFAAAPVAAATAIGLSFAGGYRYNQPSGITSIGGDYRKSDC